MATPGVTRPSGAQRQVSLDYNAELLRPLVRMVSMGESGAIEEVIKQGSVVEEEDWQRETLRLSRLAVLSKSFRSAIGSPSIWPRSGNAMFGGAGSTNGEGSHANGASSANGYRSWNLEKMVDTISNAVMDDRDSYGSRISAIRKRGHGYCFRDVSFEPLGCRWHAIVVMFYIEEGATEVKRIPFDSFQLQVVCSALEEQHSVDEIPQRRGLEDSKVSFGDEDRRGESRQVSYVLQMDLILEDGSVGDFDVDKDEKQALMKKTFDDIGLDLKKSLVRCEFPDFPEGLKGRSFRDVYQLNARLKSGSFATVCRGTHRATGSKVAVKCVLRKDMTAADDAAIYDEVAVLASVRHAYIVPLIDFFEEDECYFLVMELMSGGDLFDRIGKKKTYNERDARDLCRKMLEAVKHLHENNIAHCDMKPKNLLLTSDEDDSYIKLADFGFATRVYSPNSLTKQCGTPFFVAPEILMRNPYDQAVDMWSVGVIIYLLLSGNLPFMGRSQRELFKAIVVGKFEFSRDDWKDVSEGAKDLIRGLLVTDPSKRLTASKAMASRWIRHDGAMLARNSLMSTSQRLKTFNARMKLRSAMIAVDWVSKTSSWKSMRASATMRASAKSDEGEEGGGKIEEGQEAAVTKSGD